MSYYSNYNKAQAQHRAECYSLFFEPIDRHKYSNYHSYLIITLKWTLRNFIHTYTLRNNSNCKITAGIPLLDFIRIFKNYISHVIHFLRYPKMHSYAETVSNLMKFLEKHYSRKKNRYCYITKLNYKTKNSLKVF